MDDTGASHAIATVWLRDMETVERHVTLPADLDEAWELLTDPDDLAGWLGREVVLDPTPGATGSVVDHDGTRRRLVVDEVDAGRRLAWRWWTEGDDESQPGRDHARPRPRAAPPCTSSSTLPSGSTAAATSRPAPRLRGLVAPTPAPRGAPAGRRRRPGVTDGPPTPRRAPRAVFEALADPTRRAVLRDVAEHGPRTATELAAEPAGQPAGHRQAPRRAARRPGWSRPRAPGARRCFTATPGPAGRGGPVARPHRPGMGGPPRRLDGTGSPARRPEPIELTLRPMTGARRPPRRLEGPTVG